MKRMLVHRNQVVAMASRKQWKKYWGKLLCTIIKMLSSLIYGETSVRNSVVLYI